MSTVPIPFPRGAPVLLDARILQRSLRLNKYIQAFPTPKQAAFLFLPQIEAFYGGAGGGGKSVALLMGALQYVDIPGYAALLLRRSYSDLALPGALMDMAQDWLGGTDARWSGQNHTWSFPTGARPSTLSFGYLENERDKYRYRSAAFQYCGFDELTGFTESQYTYLFSRLRRLEGFPVPIRMRSASNPGDAGHGWVKDRFILRGAAHGRPFIPARIMDNPYLDVSSYRESLSRLDPLTRAQMEAGDWDAAAPGELFQRQWFRVVGDYPRNARMVRFWDLAGTEVMTGLNLDPDYTAGVLMAFQGGQYWIVDVKRFRLSPKKVEDLISQTAKLDGRQVDIWIEQEPGASGKIVISDYQRNVLPGYTVRGMRNSGSKSERARPFSSAAEAGNVFMVQGAWNEPFLDEVVLFPSGPHDDQVDAMSGASIALAERKGRVVLL